MAKTYADSIHDELNKAGAAAGVYAHERIADLAGQRDAARAELDAAKRTADALERECDARDDMRRASDAARQIAQYALDAAKGDRDRAYRLIGELMVLSRKKAEPGMN